ncbi:MAG: DNA topoisomerase IV subunit A [Actinomycetia bacterium]|nr:DNA topoisomerase IV subunit A [Actinomycetes bacterium]
MPRQPELLPFAREVLDVPVADEMRESFMAYSLSVITARAIPDVRDGLKPVQRRILYSMLEMGLRPANPHRKSARVVGDTMGKYHPHGDGAIYEALVRMGQSFARMITLVDPHGNFGSLDDPPAAQRYTECRLTNAAMAMVAEIDEDTVDFRSTYDGEGEEPVYLPALLPNLLVNGTSGIAVGMATNMPTHNLAEVAKAIELVMKKRRPKPTIDELMKMVPAPDFASGGIIVDDGGVREAYETGRGSFRIRARVEAVKITARRQGLMVTELPWMVGPERVVKQINQLEKDGKLPSVTDVKNLSDRKAGTRIQIELRGGVNPEAVLAELFRLTSLEESFSVNNVCLVNGVPTTLGLYDLCSLYVDHRLDVIVRRTEFRLAKFQDELHIYQGLIIALDNIDEVIRIIRGSADVPEAREALMSALGLSEIQATHILDMALRRLTALEKQKILDRRDELLAMIAECEKILGSEPRRRTLVLKELGEAVDEFGGPRRTTIMSADDIVAFEPDDITPQTTETDEPCVVSLAVTGVIGREPVGNAKKYTPGRHDVLRSVVITSTDSTIGGITSSGRLLTARAGAVGEVGGRSRGGAASEVFGTDRGEDVLAVFASEADGESLVLVTANGITKRVAPADLAELRSGRPVIKLKDRDRVVAAFTAPEDADLLIVSSDAQALRTPVAGISVQGPGAGGVAGMKLRGNAKVVGAGPVTTGDEVILTVSDTSTAKLTDSDELSAQGRGGNGVRITKFRDERRLDLAWVGRAEGTLTVVGTEANPTKPDNAPAPLNLRHTRRDGASSPTSRRIIDVGQARW